MTIEEIEKYFEICEFDGECDFCENPEGKTFAQWTRGEYGDEVDFYICEKCAPLEIQMIKEEYERWEKYADQWINETMQNNEI